MATIGLKDIYYAVLEEDGEDETKYEDPKRMGKAMTANVEPSFESEDLRADDGVAETAESRGATTVTIGTDDLDAEVQADIYGKKINDDGVLLDNEDDKPPYVAIMFKSEKANGKYRYVVLYKGKFTPPEVEYETKQDTPEFTTPETEGRFIGRESDGLYGAQIDEDGEDVDEDVIDNWFDEVYDPSDSGE